MPKGIYTLHNHSTHRGGATTILANVPQVLQHALLMVVAFSATMFSARLDWIWHILEASGPQLLPKDGLFAGTSLSSGACRESPCEG